MSGPVVAIGFILLVPSVLGMIFCAAMLLGVNVLTGTLLATSADHPYQSAYDADFRRNCALGTVNPVSQQRTEQFCECALPLVKDGHDFGLVIQMCNHRLNNGTLAKPSAEIDALYTDTSPKTGSAGGTAALSILGDAAFLYLGITFFVSGLLGWLLVMRKRILQCDVCGAVVTAS
jgi:hypothetical protein